MRCAVLAIAALLGVCGAPSLAQTSDSLKQCARIPGADARLACYDGIVAATDATFAAELATRKREADARAAEEQRLAAEQAEKAKISSFGAGALPSRDRHEAKSATADEISAKVVSVALIGPDKYSIRLDNGQAWSQVEAKTLPKILPGDDVVIKRATLGSFRMKLMRINRTIQVLRRR